MNTTLRHHRPCGHPDRRGTALILALVVVTIVAMLGAGFIQLTASLASRQSEAVDTQKAFYLAEAGLAESFQAVRMGRTGQVASLEAPARYGDGLVWVDVVELEDGTVRLDSNGLCGSGRSSLSLVVEPVEIALGFFADEDLVVDAPILLDGFDSDEGAYAPAAPTAERLYIDPSYPFLHDDPVNRILFYEGTFYRYSSYESDRIEVEVVVPYQAVVDDPEFDAFGCGPDDFTDDGWLSDYDVGHEYSGVLGYFRKLDQSRLITADSNPLRGAPVMAPADAGGADGSEGDGAEPGAAAPEGFAGGVLGPTTGGGGLLGSNGDVHFQLPAGETAEIWGDVQPGKDRALTGLDAVTVSGNTSPRLAPVELPDVELPIIAQASPVRHDDLLPMLISAGSSGYARIEVAPDAELVIRGPATVLVGSLILEPGALLTLDTRSGEVSLFVTDELDLQAGSSVVTSGGDSGETSVQVSSTANDPLDPAVKLGASAQFHGTVYAPRTDVRIGADFEIFGSVIAERLEIAPGARLHFDNAGFSGTALPRIVGWRLIEVPAAIRAGGRDPIRALGLDVSTLPELAGAHDLDEVQLDLEYVDLSGVPRSYSGAEDAFNWLNVEQIVKVERDPVRQKEQSDTAEPGSEPPPEPVGVRGDISDALTSLSGTQLKDNIIAKSPLSDDEIVAVIDAMKMTSAVQKDALMASSPLGEAPLLRLLDCTGVTTSSDLRTILIAASPLPPSVLDSVTANDSLRLTPPDRSAILTANR